MLATPTLMITGKESSGKEMVCEEDASICTSKSRAQFSTAACRKRESDPNVETGLKLRSENSC